jgi:hypothetical protein
MARYGLRHTDGMGDWIILFRRYALLGVYQHQPQRLRTSSFSLYSAKYKRDTFY